METNPTIARVVGTFHDRISVPSGKVRSGGGRKGVAGVGEGFLVSGKYTTSSQHFCRGIGMARWAAKGYSDGAE